MVRIKDSVFYHRYGDYMYVRDVDQQKDFLYNEIVGDILDHVQRDSTEEQAENLIKHLQSIYDLTDMNLD